MNMKWNKLPSVRAGGKPYFYTTFNEKREKTTVVWSRLEGQWLAIGDMQSGEEIYGLFPTRNKAIKYVESL